MKKIIWILLFGTALVSCAGRKRTAAQISTPPPAVRNYTCRVVNSYPHSAQSYTQGLEFHDGVLWEGTGEHGHSHLQRVDLETGGVTVVASLPRSEFGEGITILGDKIYQLTWTSNKGYIYNLADGKKLGEFSYLGEGWGLANDGKNLYMSDGTEYIRIIDPTDFRTVKSLTVTCEGRPLRLLNELEWIDGKIWANVYTTDYIAIIDPASGRVEGFVHLDGLLPDDQITPETDVLNGIAGLDGRIFVTGKRWSRLFEIEIIEQ